MTPHNQLKNRYEVRGLLQLETALHVGTGLTSATTDAAVIQDFLSRPIIPGSSLKGALRSALDRRVEWLGMRSCRLENRNPICLTTNELPDAPHPVPANLNPDRPGRHWREQSLSWRLRQMESEEGLCHVCQTFGSTIFGGKVQIDDLPLVKDLDAVATELVELRDGVGIDRDSGTAVEGIKFDYQVVPSIAAFRCYITAENLDAPGLALLSLGLLELMNGNIPLGGKTSRGLGRCRLRVTSLHQFQFSGAGNGTAVAEIIQYLQPRGEHGIVNDVVGFLQGNIKEYLESQDAQAPGQ